MRNRPYRGPLERRAEELCSTDNRFGGPNSVVHDYPGAYAEAERERKRNTPLARRERREIYGR